jgi:hypothetical protein
MCLGRLEPSPETVLTTLPVAPSSVALGPPPKLSSAAGRIRAGRATIAFCKSDRPDGSGADGRDGDIAVVAIEFGTGYAVVEARLRQPSYFR